jgi:hypothetical protein
MQNVCFDLRACTRSTSGDGCILSRFFSFILTSNKFDSIQTSEDVHGRNLMVQTLLHQDITLLTYTHAYIDT